MAGKGQLWREFWREALEILREYNPSTQKEFQRVFP